MTIAGISIILLLGITLLLLLVFQLLTGLHVVKVGLKTHKKTGILLVALATIHGLLAIISNL